MLPSTWSSKRSARPPAPATEDDLHHQSPRHSGSRSLSSPRGRRGLAAQLRWLLCGCGLLYVVLLWHSGLWTIRSVSGSRAVATSMRVTTTTAATPPVEMASEHAPVEIQSPTTPQPAADSASAVPLAPTTMPTAPPTAVYTAVPATLAIPTMSVVPASATTLIHTAIGTTTVSSTTGVDVEWLRSRILTWPDQAASASAAATTVPLSLEAHTARMQQLESSREKLQLSVDQLKARLADVRTQLVRHATVVADEDAKLVHPLPRDRAVHKLVCLGWRATAGCHPRGPRDPKNDKTCTQRVAAKSAGYCEVQDPHTKERFRIMETSCDTLRWDAHLSCADAPSFANFSTHANKVLRQQRQHVQQNQQSQHTHVTRGIVLVVYPQMLPSAYATLRTLRRLACSLPVELWYAPSELPDAHAHAIIRAMVDQLGPVTLRAIEDPKVKGFTTKIHAIHHSAFDQVLFLDADNVPVRDPTYLFALPEFMDTGALFWPDFWHPNHTIFAVHERSLVWKYLDVPFVDMFEQESGQLVIDKTRSETAMTLLELYAHHTPNLLEKFKLVHGDKDLFRLAWLKSNTSFFMVDHPPAIAGNVMGDMFCGQTMGQFDPQGELLFLHRNAKKLQGRHAKKPKTVIPAATIWVEHVASDADTEEDPAIWTHLLQLKPTSTRGNYTVEIYKGSAQFPTDQWCYGKPSPAAAHFNTFRFADLPVRDVESEIRAYATEATDLLRTATATATMETRQDEMRER